MVKTATNPYPPDWAIQDAVTRLRVLGTDDVFLLDATPGRGPYMIGTASTCSFRIVDRSRRVSRAHAQLLPEAGRWTVVDLASKNGLRVDGVPVARQVLTPGMEIDLGGAVTLLAESEGVIALRAALARLVGWSASRASLVEQALRSTRQAAQRRAVLVVAGERDLVPIARDIHERTLTADRPFVVCAPHLQSETLRYPERSLPTAMGAAAEAKEGTVCLLQHMLPDDLLLMLASRGVPGPHPQLMVCSSNVQDVQLFTGAAVVLPPLLSRAAELPRLIEEYEREACAEFQAAPSPLTSIERAWIRKAARSLPEMQQMVERLVAAHAAGSFSAAAELFGMTHRAFIKWLDHRGYPRSARRRNRGELA